jgi:hypothetical protein
MFRKGALEDGVLTFDDPAAAEESAAPTLLQAAE